MGANSNKVTMRGAVGLHLFNNVYRKKIKEHALRTLFWEMTLRCNLACGHCGSDCRRDAQLPDMPIADFLRVIDTITPHVDPHRVMIVFSGGEPLVRNDLEVCGLELYKRGYPWGMVTNGMLLDERRFESLLRAGLHSITVSLDGFEAYHNRIRGHAQSFAKALRAVRLISCESSVVYDVVTCVSGTNIDDLPKFKEFLIAEGVRHWRIFSIFPVGRAANDESLKVSDEQLVWLLEFIEQTRREGRINISYACEGFLGRFEGTVRDSFYHCSAGVSTASIRVDGAISGCTSIRAGLHQGNIYQDDFMDVWNNRFGKFRDRKWMYRDQCEGCEAWKWCQGGGMHLRDDDGKLLLCHYRRLVPQKQAK